MSLWPPLNSNINYITAAPNSQWIDTKVKEISILGSTGSIGVNTLKVIEKFPEYFKVIALAGATNITLLAKQACKWRPKYLGVLNYDYAAELLKLLPHNYRPQIVVGQDGYAQVASLPEINIVISAQVGSAGLRATVAAAIAGKVICLANKESLVLAGHLIRTICAQSKAVILPVDSEHNAIFQALAGREAPSVKRIILTASGGPFHNYDLKKLQKVTLKEALRHPNWTMGSKITIDSATLMNKGLEIIEAHHLYGVALDKIHVVIHPQSIIHSLVEFNDASLMAHMGKPDMRMAIAHCLMWPMNCDAGVGSLELEKMVNLSFKSPNFDLFPCLNLAKRALKDGPAQCIVLNAANEAAVDLFLKEKIPFLHIAEIISTAMNHHAKTKNVNKDFCPALDHIQNDNILEILEKIERLDKQVRDNILQDIK